MTCIICQSLISPTIYFTHANFTFWRDLPHIYFQVNIYVLTQWNNMLLNSNQETFLFEWTLKEKKTKHPYSKCFLHFWTGILSAESGNQWCAFWNHFANSSWTCLHKWNNYQGIVTLEQSTLSTRPLDTQFQRGLDKTAKMYQIHYRTFNEDKKQN